MVKTIRNLIITSFILVIIVAIVMSFISFSNGEINIKNRFEGVMKERTSFYSTIHSIISKKVQISKKVDESFKENVNIIMTNRKDGENIMWKWVQESNPNANFEEVSKIYQDLSRTIEAKQVEFFNIEKKLADIEREYKDFTLTFPNSMYFSILNKIPIEYEPIMTEDTKQVFETGIDNNTKLDL